MFFFINLENLGEGIFSSTAIVLWYNVCEFTLQTDIVKSAAEIEMSQKHSFLLLGNLDQTPTIKRKKA